jgi:prevent-host-death family protein
MPKEVEIPFTALRRAGADTIENVRHQKERVIITNYGKPVAAIVSIEDLELIKSAKKSKE